MTLNQLRQTVERNRGDWPDRTFGPASDPSEYAKRQANLLLHSGLFIPMLNVHCSHCRVDSQVNAKDLDAVLRCEFCGKDFRLALSLSLTPPQWKYRLASHLAADKVKALLPAIATTSLLGQLRAVEAAPLNHMLGVQLNFSDGKSIELYVAAYVPDQTWAVVVGEVKSSNLIDANDIANLGFIQQRLHERQVRCIPLVATLKEHLSHGEIALLPKHAEQAQPVSTAFGQLVPSMPLVLVARDLSLPWGNESHPWRWGNSPPSIPGLLGTAIDSCKRNLGLTSYSISRDAGFAFEWSTVSENS